MKIGELISGDGAIHCNQGLQVTQVEVENTSDHTVQVTSHYHFFETNKRLVFDRAATYGKRLDIAAGSAVRFEPGEKKVVHLVELTGRRRVFGFQGFVNGALGESQAGVALATARARGFLDTKV